MKPIVKQSIRFAGAISLCSLFTACPGLTGPSYAAIQDQNQALIVANEIYSACSAVYEEPPTASNQTLQVSDLRIDGPAGGYCILNGTTSRNHDSSPNSDYDSVARNYTAVFHGWYTTKDGSNGSSTDQKLEGAMTIASTNISSVAGSDYAFGSSSLNMSADGGFQVEFYNSDKYNINYGENIRDTIGFSLYSDDSGYNSTSGTITGKQGSFKVD